MLSNSNNLVILKLSLVVLKPKTALKHLNLTSKQTKSQFEIQTNVLLFQANVISLREAVQGAGGCGGLGMGDVDAILSKIDLFTSQNDFFHPIFSGRCLTASILSVLKSMFY